MYFGLAATRFAALVATLASVLAAQAQLKEVATAGSTAALVDTVFGRVNESIERARNAGDYVSVITLVRLKDALDAWKQTNADLMHKAEDSLDEAAIANFGRARSAIADLNEKAEARVRSLATLTESANQFVASLPGGRPYVARFEPRVVPPQAERSYTIRVNGVNLDQANPTISSGAAEIERVIIGPNEVQYTIPTSLTPADASKIQVHLLTLTYASPADGVFARFMGRTKEVVRQLPIVSLPHTLATYEVTGNRVHQKRLTMPHTANLGEFRGRNQDIPKIALPPAEWKWDLGLKDSFRLIQGEGIQGTCIGMLWNESSENGIKAYARVDKVGRSTKYPNGAPGRVNCSFAGTVYRLEPTVESLDVTAGRLGWLADQTLDVPKDVRDLKVSIKIFDGRKRVFTSTDSDRFFDMKVERGAITFTPKVPGDLLAVQ